MPVHCHHLCGFILSPGEKVFRLSCFPVTRLLYSFDPLLGEVAPDTLLLPYYSTDRPLVQNRKTQRCILSYSCLLSLPWS